VGMQGRKTQSRRKRRSSGDYGGKTVSVEIGLFGSPGTETKGKQKYRTKRNPRKKELRMGREILKSHPNGGMGVLQREDGPFTGKRQMRTPS